MRDSNTENLYRSVITWGLSWRKPNSSNPGGFLTLVHAQRTHFPSKGTRNVEPPRGFEPRTYALRVRSKPHETGGTSLFRRDLLSPRMMAFQGLAP